MGRSCTIYHSLISLIAYLSICSISYADETDQVAGIIEGYINGQSIKLAALTSDYEIVISGDLAEVKLTQTFSNPYSHPLNATYLFPLNQHAAVHAMRMILDDEVVVATINEINQAKQIFEKAKKTGKAAALLEQHRPNMFTQRVANLMPGRPMEIEIKYTQTVPKIDSAYELVVPLVVGPRFQPAGAGVPPSTESTAEEADESQYPDDLVKGGESGNQDTPYGQWQLEALPKYPPVVGVHLPETIDPARVTLQIRMESPVPIQQIVSATHDLAIIKTNDYERSVQFAAGRVVDNRDLVMRYTLSGEESNSGLLSHFDASDGGYFSLLIEPPHQISDQSILPREMVFLLDCSGSMNGLPMQASKAFMTNALKQLKANDTFRIIRFSDSATEFSSRPLAATQSNIQRGLLYTRGLRGSGGTRMTSGIRQALQTPVAEGAVRNVVFLTDGYIGNEIEVLQLVDELRNASRLYAFGVGAGVNRYLLSELGRVGRGFTRYFDPTQGDAEDLNTTAAHLAKRLRTPLLTDVSIDWGGLPVKDIYPQHLPDLYAGDSIRVSGRFEVPVSGEILIEGRGSDKQASLRSVVHLEQSAQRPAIRSIWARQAVKERMHELITPQPLRNSGRNDSQLKKEIINLGLNYNLVTRWTAFVAVSEAVHNSDSEKSQEASVALPKVAGVSKLAYSQPTLTGFGAPEPEMLAGLFVGLMTWGWILGRRRFQRLKA